DLLPEITEIPFQRYIGLVRLKEIVRKPQVRHVRLEEQSPRAHGFEIAPTDFAVAKRAEAKLRVEKLSKVLATRDTVTGHNTMMSLHREDIVLRLVSHPRVPLGTLGRKARVEVDVSLSEYQRRRQALKHMR